MEFGISDSSGELISMTMFITVFCGVLDSLKFGEPELGVYKFYYFLCSLGN